MLGCWQLRLQCKCFCYCSSSTEALHCIQASAPPRSRSICVHDASALHLPTHPVAQSAGALSPARQQPFLWVCLAAEAPGWHAQMWCQATVHMTPTPGHRNLRLFVLLTHTSVLTSGTANACGRNCAEVCCSERQFWAERNLFSPKVTFSFRTWMQTPVPATGHAKCHSVSGRACSARWKLFISSGDRW